MRRKILEDTPKELQTFTRLYTDIIVRIGELMKEKDLTQKDLALMMDKMPSEVNKWLSGDYNFTLRSLAKLQVELGEPIIYVPKSTVFQTEKKRFVKLTLHRHQVKAKPVKYKEWSHKTLNNSSLPRCRIKTRLTLLKSRFVNSKSLKDK